MEALGDKLSSIIIDHDYQLYICLSQISDLLGENAFKRLSLHCIMIVMNKKKKKKSFSVYHVDFHGIGS